MKFPQTAGYLLHRLYAARHPGLKPCAPGWRPLQTRANTTMQVNRCKQILDLLDNTGASIFFISDS